MPSKDCAFRSCVLLFISITLAQVYQSESSESTCDPSACDQSQCSPPTDCDHGIVDDHCHCCKVCLKNFGEPCGTAIGKCAKGLQCLTTEHSDPVLTNSVISGDKQIGSCGHLNCTGVKCHDHSDNDDNVKCQSDSYKKMSDHSCCQTTCVCLPGVCETSRPHCPNNMFATVVRAGDGKPGSCCDLVECRDVPTKCIHNNKQYLNGEKWKSDKCTTCECRDGLTFCQKKECKPIINCKAIAVISDECCPICQGCLSSDGKFYNNTHKWYENECTHCECIEGAIRCRSEMCSPLSCEHKINVEGQCCPICSDTSLECDIYCNQGYKRDPSGKELCECNLCPDVNVECQLLCPLGYKKGSDECHICQCNTDINMSSQYRHVNKDDSSCNASNGSIVANGRYWNDGCRECLCNSGKVMCTKPDCPPIKCSNAKLIEGKCCPVCDDNQNKASKSGSVDSNHLHSHLFITAVILTLIIAILLLGIFLLLAIYILKKYPNFKYPRNRVINRTVKDNAIIHLWPYSRSAGQVPRVADNQMIGIRVTESNLLNQDMGHSLQEKLLTTCNCAD